MKVYKGIGNQRGLVAKTDTKNVFIKDIENKSDWVKSTMSCEYLNFCVYWRWYEEINEEEAFEICL